MISYPEIFRLHIALGNCGQYLGELHEAIDQGVVHVVQIQAVMACPCLIIHIFYQIYSGFIGGSFHPWCSTCPLVFGCCDLSHMIFFILRKKELLAKAEQIHKVTTIFTQNCSRLSLWAKIFIILQIYSTFQAVLSACEKSDDSTANSQKLEDM